MLAGILAYVALIAIAAATILSAGMAMTRMSIERMTRPYFSSGYERAAAALEQSVAADMQRGGIPYPAPSFTPIPAACANSACTYLTAETIMLTQTAPATPGPACDSSQTNCAPNVQTNSYVAEGRVSAQITVNVLNAQGYSIAARTGTVVLRTFDSPPYVAIAGARDGAFDNVLSAANAGDDGGAPPATPNPCASASSISDDTAVRVEYRNKDTSACMDGSAWGDSSYSTHVAPTGWSP
ncbi:MAG TPA: hypothetical protein VFN37_02415 [Candidatus Baltobacteraceae bacterium]|nr:hypothetical protein [Candidatus Baltobacteraceae bacterium]